MKTLALVIGHGPKKDKGAENSDGTTELAWNRDLADRIAAALDQTKVKAIRVNRVIEKVTPIMQVNATGAAFAIELHLNAFNGTASGTEMLHHNRSAKGKLLATLMQKAAVSVLGLPDRGLKPLGSGSRGYTFVSKTAMPAIIVESFFIDNNKDLSEGNKKKDALAAAYARALEAF